MKDIYPKIVELFEMNRFSVLATRISQSGSAPRSVGTKLLILEDGSSVGTIGGGLLEMSIREESKKVFASRLPARFSPILKETDGADPDMLCGGDIEVFLEPVYPDNLSHLQIFKEVMDVLRRGGSGVLATVVDADQWHARQIPKMFLKSNGERIGSLMDIREIEDAIMERMDQLLSERQPSMIICRDKEYNQLYVFVEPVVSNPILYIFGGGHVSSQVVPLANRVGFRVVVIDDRAEFSDPKNFVEAEEVHHYPFEGVMGRLPVNESSYLVITTRGHSHDKTVLAQALKTPAKYIGMIGSGRKISIIYKKLMEEGFTQEELDQVRSPIGIGIGAETPEEIAVSIVAELIKARAGV
ncbi:XdhC family aldehyde oxidoreductase maturation factor [Thermodesulfobacteriota bacterium]